eukprot:1270671-Prymnesium_polylepis.3
MAALRRASTAAFLPPFNRSTSVATEVMRDALEEGSTNPMSGLLRRASASIGAFGAHTTERLALEQRLEQRRDKAARLLQVAHADLMRARRHTRTRSIYTHNPHATLRIPLFYIPHLRIPHFHIPHSRIPHSTSMT